MNFLNWLTAPKYDLSSFRVVVLNCSEIPWTLLFIESTPCCDSLYPTLSILSAANLQ